MRKFCIFAITLVLAFSLMVCCSSEDEQYQESRYTEVTPAVQTQQGDMFRVVYEQDAAFTSPSLKVIEFVPNGALFVLTSSGDICPIMDWGGHGAQPYDMDDLNAWLR